METTQTTAARSSKTPAKYSKKQITLMVIAVVATVIDCVSGFMVGDDKTATIVLVKDVAHLVSIASIVALLFIGKGWATFTKAQKPFIGIAIALYSIGGVMDLMNHAGGMVELTFPSLIVTNVAFLAVIVAFIIGMRNKTRKK